MQSQFCNGCNGSSGMLDAPASLLGRALDFATENVLLTLAAVIAATFLIMTLSRQGHPRSLCTATAQPHCPLHSAHALMAHHACTSHLPVCLQRTHHSALAPTPKPAEYTGASCGDITAASLRKYDGRDPFLPLFFAVRGEVFDVSRGRDFYGPGAPLLSRL